MWFSFFTGAIHGFFFHYYHLFSTVLIQLVVNNFAMTGIEPRISVYGSDRSTNCATTTAPAFLLSFFLPKLEEAELHFLLN